MRIMMFIFILTGFAGLLSCGSGYDAGVRDALSGLDRMMDDREIIEQRKEREIERLCELIDKAGGIYGKYLAMDSLFDAYRLYNIDSTMYYAYKKEDLALASRDSSLIIDACLDIIRMNAISGLYVEALDELSDVDTVGLSEKLLYQYAETSVSLYESMSEIYASHPQGAYYDRQLEESRQLLQAQEQVFQDGLTAFRQSLSALGLDSYAAMDNSQLLAAMADTAQAAVLDGALDSARASLDSGVQLLRAIEALRAQLGEHADVPLASLEEQQRTLEAGVAQLEAQLLQLQSELDGLTPEDEDYEAKREILSQQLQSCQAQLEELKSQLTDLSALIAARQQLDLLEAQRDSCGLTDTTADALQAQLDALYTTDAEGQTVPVGTAVFLAGQQQIQQGWEQIADGEAELSSASRRLSSARRQLREAEEELEAVEQELEEGTLIRIPIYDLPVRSVDTYIAYQRGNTNSEAIKDWNRYYREAASAAK